VCDVVQWLEVPEVWDKDTVMKLDLGVVPEEAPEVM
jgi:hypothetical protein